MANGNDYSQYTQGMTEAQANEFARLAEIYNTRFQRQGARPDMEGLEAEELTLSDYSQDIQNILRDDRYSQIVDSSKRRAMDKMLSDYGFEAAPYFDANPTATSIDVMRATNFNGFADKEKRYSDPSTFTNESGRSKAKEELYNEYESTFQNSFLFPELGSGLRDIVPDYIKNDPEKMADFESAFYYETGGAKIDFDESGRIGGVYTDSSVGNFMREGGYKVVDVGNQFVEWAATTSNTLYSILGGDLDKKNKEFLKRQEEGEIETEFQRLERGRSEGVGFNDPIFWASFTSPEARQQLLRSSSGLRTVDFNAMMDRGGPDDAGQLLSVGLDQIIQSVPLMIDLVAGGGIAKGLLRGTSKKLATEATKKSLKAVNLSAAKVSNLMNQGGAFVVSGGLVAGQIHSDNIGQEWYDNLSEGERFNYLAVQAGSEVLSGMVLNRAFARGFGKSAMTHNIFKSQQNAVKEWGKNAARSTFLGIGEESIAEAGTAAVQYYNEVNARRAGGDESAYIDGEELKRKVFEGAVAGILMGGMAGGLSGTIGGGAQATLATLNAKAVESKKKVDEAAKAMDAANTLTGKKEAMERLEREVKRHSGAQSALSRAYNRIREASPEKFEEIARLQGEINVNVENYKKNTNEEGRGALFQEIKSLVEKKQQLENEAFEGDTKFEDVIKEEFENVAKERGAKVKAFNASMESDPETLAQKEIAGELESQKASLEAAKAVNAPEQNTDDDTQDQQGETQEDSDMQRNPDAPIEGVEGDANNLMSPTDLEGQPLAGKYRDIVGRVNNLLKAFKPLGINAVVHTTEQSFFNATGATSLGMFRQGKTVHINLEKANAGTNTVRHEFLHAAFMTLTPQQKQQFLEELRSIRGINARNIERAVEETYSDYDSESLIEEKIVNILENALDSTSLEARQSTIQKIANFFRRLLGLKEQITESDLQGFVRQFRAAERSGVEFEGGRASQGADMDARDLGMNRGGFKSTAYPDLIRKKVSYAKTFLNKTGEQYQLFDEVFVNDYWHFRNWWIRETGNGKRGDVLSDFTYEGENGQRKKINPPRPKVDKSTGEIVDMEPKLQTPFEMKFAANQRAAGRRDMSADRDSATDSLVGGILEVVGLSKRGGRKESRTELFVDSRGSETEGRSELPVVFSDTIFTEGLRNMQFQNEYGDAVRSTMEDFAFLVPKDQSGEFAYSIRNNGDGSVTIEAHSDFIPIDQAGDGESVAQGKTNLSEGLEARVLNVESEEFLGKEANRGTMQADTQNTSAFAVGFDQTKDKSGVADLVKRGVSLISAHIDRAKAEAIEATLIRMALEEAKGMKDGDIGYITVYQTLLSPDSTLGNPLVFSDMFLGKYESRDGSLKRFVEKQRLVDFLNSSFKKDAPLKNSVRNLLEGGTGLESVFDLIKTGEEVVLTDEQYNEISQLIGENSRAFSFNQRTEIAKALFKDRNISKTIFLNKHNDPIWQKAGVEKGEIVAYTVIPFKYNKKGKTDRAKIEGFISRTDSNKDNPFQGLIVPAAVVDGKIVDGAQLEDRDGNKVPLPQTKIPTKAYHVTEVFGGKYKRLSKDKGQGLVDENVDLRKKPESEQQGLMNTQVAIGIRGRAFDPDNSTVRINEDSEAQGVKSKKQTKKTAEVIRESRDLGLSLDNQTELPFEPNNLNSFQAFMARMDQLFANKYANVMRLQKTIEKAKGKVVDLSKDFINAEALLYGKTANDLDKLDGKVKDISLEMKDKGLNSEDVSEYLIARHAKERNAVISERTEGKDEAGSGMTNERADEIMNSLSPEKKAALESVAAKVDAITADTRKTMVEFGLEEKSTIDAFEAMFQNYVPLGGLALDEQNADTSLYPTGGAGMSVYGDTTKRARGRKSEAQNVLAQAIAQNAAVHAKARKNEALSSLYKLVKDNPNPKVWRLAKEVPFDAQSAVGVRVNGEQQFIVFANPDMAKSLKNMGVEKLDLFSKAMRRFSGFLRRSFTTANPEFIISNFARDIQSAMFNAMAEADIPGGQIPGRHIAANVMTRVKQTLPALLKNAVGKDLSPEIAAYFEEFKEDGGQTGWGFVKDVETIAAEIESEVNEKSKAKKASEWMARNSIEVIENVNDAFENSVRLAAYIEARKAGVSREKAAELAKNITVNFNRSGELGPMANAWYMFFNASVQGTVRLARSLGTMKDLRKPNGELESRFKRLNAAQKMAFGLSLTTGMLTMVNMAMSDDDEDGVSFYEKIPDYEKERNLIIMYSGKNYFKVPLPYGFNVFANLGTSMAETANGQREPLDAGMFLLNSAFSSFSPISFGQSKDASKYLAKGLSPTILKPFVDIAVNETYFGSSVYREQFPVGAPKPQAEMSYRSPEGVRSFFQWMNEATGGSEQVPGSADFNPDKFWYGFEYYIGGAGQFITRSLGTGKDLFETIKEGKKVPMKANDFPFLRKLYGEASKYYDSDTYTDNANLVSQLYKERKEAEDKNDKRYKGVMKLESARKATEKKIKRLRKLRKEARDIKNYVEKQNRIYELYEKERSLLMQFNKQYEQLRGKD
jgi:hypothetical protein